MTQRCSSCGTENVATARFCRRCGMRLGPAAAPAAASSTSGSAGASQPSRTAASAPAASITSPLRSPVSTDPSTTPVETHRFDSPVPARHAPPGVSPTVDSVAAVDARPDGWSNAAIAAPRFEGDSSANTAGTAASSPHAETPSRKPAASLPSPPASPQADAVITSPPNERPFPLPMPLDTEPSARPHQEAGPATAAPATTSGSSPQPVESSRSIGWLGVAVIGLLMIAIGGYWWTHQAGGAWLDGPARAPSATPAPPGSPPDVRPPTAEGGTADTSVPAPGTRSAAPDAASPGSPVPAQADPALPPTSPASPASPAPTVDRESPPTAEPRALDGY